MAKEFRFCKDCPFLVLRTYYLKTEKVNGYCSMIRKKRNGDDDCTAGEGGNVSLHRGNVSLHPQQLDINFPEKSGTL